MWLTTIDFERINVIRTWGIVFKGGFSWEEVDWPTVSLHSVHFSSLQSMGGHWSCEGCLMPRPHHLQYVQTWMLHVTTFRQFFICKVTIITMCMCVKTNDICTQKDFLVQRLPNWKLQKYFSLWFQMGTLEWNRYYKETG